MTTRTSTTPRVADAYLDLLHDVAQAGERTFRYGETDRLLVTDVAEIHEVLARGSDDMRLTPVTAAAASVQGDGLLMSSLPRWRPRRLVIQRQLAPSKLRPKAEVIARNTRRVVDGWATGDRFDLREPLHALALDNLGDVVFGSDFRAVRAVIREAMDVTIALLEEANAGDVHPATEERLAAAVEDLDVLVGDLITSRTGEDDARTDILEVLVRAARSGDEVFADPWARDEAVTLILAGHDAIAFLTVMCAWLVSTHPPVRDALREQVDSALAAGAAAADLADQVPLAKQVVEEVLRLYPPVPVLHRTAPADFRLGDRTVAPGTILVLSPWVTHYDPQCFADPWRFDPGRFSPERRGEIPRHAYYPFGMGRRICAGNHFSLLQCVLTLALVAGAADLDVRRSDPPALIAPVGMRVDSPVEVEVTRR